MANHFSPQGAPGWDLLLALGIGAAVIVALASAASPASMANCGAASVKRIR